MTQEALAERTELTPNYIGTIENGKRDLSLSTLVSLAHGLDVPVGELLGPPPPLSESALEFARLFDKTGPEFRQAMLLMLRSLMG